MLGMAAATELFRKRTLVFLRFNSTEQKVAMKVSFGFFFRKFQKRSVRIFQTYGLIVRSNGKLFYAEKTFLGQPYV